MASRPAVPAESRQGTKLKKTPQRPRAGVKQASRSRKAARTADFRRSPRISSRLQATDVIPIERSSAYRGLYHCLGGKLSPLDDVEPEDLNIRSLVERVAGQPGCEVILATGSDVEGEATATYLHHLLKALDCKISRPAQGLPAGSGLSHADTLTLMKALEGRTVL